jgi:hypothetical protein
MKKLIPGLLALALAFTPSLGAAPDDEADVRDLKRLQQELEYLDDELVALEDDSPARARELRQRADEIRDETTYLKVKMSRHQERGQSGVGVTTAEIEDLRRDVRDLRADIQGFTQSPRSADIGGTFRVPEGTELSIQLEESLSSATAQNEDRFKATVERSVRINDVVVIPAGAEVRGIVQDARPAERLRRAGRLELTFDSLTLDNTRHDLRTRIVALQDEDASKETTRKAGIGAIIGGVIGGLLKGRTGAMIGVLAGGGVVVAQKGEDVELPEGTTLQVRLEQPLEVQRR